MFAPCHCHGWAPVPTAEVVVGLLAAVIYRPPSIWASEHGNVQSNIPSTGSAKLHDLPKNWLYAYLYAETLLT
jgi:hypothetical protein